MENNGIRWYIFCIHIICLLAAIMFSVATCADTNVIDLSIGMKTIPLLTDEITNPISIAIIFDPADTDSKLEANKIKSILDAGLEVIPDLELAPVLVPTDNLPKIAESEVAILTSGLSSHYDDISNAAAGHNVLTMSTDLKCVKAHKCVLGIVSKPRTKIYYSKDAADSAHIRFSTAFIEIVKQI